MRFVPPPPRPPPLRHRLRRVLVSTTTPASAGGRSDIVAYVSASGTSTFVFPFLLSSLHHRSCYRLLPPSLPPLPSFLASQLPHDATIATCYRRYVNHHFVHDNATSADNDITSHQRQRYASLHFTSNATTDVADPNIILGHHPCPSFIAEVIHKAYSPASISSPVYTHQ